MSPHGSSLTTTCVIAQHETYSPYPTAVACLCPVARDRGPHRGCACALSQFTALVGCEAVSINVTEGWGAAGAHDASCLWELWGGDDTLEILEHFHDSDYALLHVLVRVCRTWSSCETGHTIPVLLCACTYLRVARIAPPPQLSVWLSSGEPHVAQ